MVLCSLASWSPAGGVKETLLWVSGNWGWRISVAICPASITTFLATEGFKKLKASKVWKSVMTNIPPNWHVTKTQKKNMLKYGNTMSKPLNRWHFSPFYASTSDTSKSHKSSRKRVGRLRNSCESLKIWSGWPATRRPHRLQFFQVLVQNFQHIWSRDKVIFLDILDVLLV